MSFHDFEEGDYVRVIVDCITGSHLGSQNLKDKEAVVLFVYGENMVAIRFFDTLKHLGGGDVRVGTPDAGFQEHELKYLGHPGIDCPYPDDYYPNSSQLKAWNKAAFPNSVDDISTRSSSDVDTDT